MSEAFQENQNKDLFVTGKSSHSGSEPEDSVIIKARFYTLSHRQPQTNTFCYVKKLHEGLPPPPAGIGLNIYFYYHFSSYNAKPKI